VKVTKDMLDSARQSKAAEFDPVRFEDHYEDALTELINAKRQGKSISAKPRPRGENVVDLYRSAEKKYCEQSRHHKGKKPRKASAGQKEMLLPVKGKKQAEKKAATLERATKRKAG
jgi:DNA end-binding protein Ku